MKNSSLNIVIRYSSLGDLVLCSSFIEKLHLHNPDTKSALVTLQSLSDTARGFHVQPNLIVGMPPSSWAILFKSWHALRSIYTDYKFTTLTIYDLHKVPKSFAFRFSAFIFCLINKITYKSRATSKNSFWRWLSLVLKKDFSPKRHIYSEHQKLLEPHEQILNPKLRKNTEPHSKSPLKKILIAPDSQHWKKKWPVTHWEKFFHLAQKDLGNVEFTLVGELGVFPQDFIDNLSDIYGERFKNRLGRLPLSDLGFIASTHTLCICGNSAWQHIAEAVEVPVISLPGPIIKGFGFSPFLTQSRELSVDLKCRPCTRHGGGSCHLKGDDFHACMKRITPATLIKNCQEMLM